MCRSVSLATEEMTRQFDIVDEVQLPCSKILVRFGSRNHNVQKVMETLLLKFQPGSPSHYYVITTLSDLATCNPTHVVPFLKTILTTMMANMKATKKDYLRYLRLSTYVFSLLSKAYPLFGTTCWYTIFLNEKINTFMSNLGILRNKAFLSKSSLSNLGKTFKGDRILWTVFSF